MAFDTIMKLYIDKLTLSLSRSPENMLKLEDREEIRDEDQQRNICSCFANPHEMLGKRIMKRACDLKDEFSTFYTSLELEQREELEENIKILLRKVVTNIDYVDEVTRLAEDFGQRFVELRSAGFRPDYFAVMADATIKECTHLDSAVHKAHTTTQAFSQFGALVGFFLNF
ncbi:hypothetical protein OESDEN_15700 [Oesophagostomum dentatum]|uniref:Uncharacterized protein n=1 Tax=Oesophagostomum dentatum TaxID=61180 RepID=A0A0B1SI45_OESDE|nr:hypothetical protein OESDEN_15700 [Oesophagostomum dentatum]